MSEIPEARKLNRGDHTDCLLELGIYDKLIPEQKAEIAQLKGENAVLKQFARMVLDDYNPGRDEVIGCAVELGLLCGDGEDWELTAILKDDEATEEN